LLRYRNQLESWLNSCRGVDWSRKEYGHYTLVNTRVNTQKESDNKEINPNAIKQGILQYMMDLDKLPVKESMEQYTPEEQSLICTLFPLMSPYLREYSWKDSLEMACIWIKKHFIGLTESY